MVWSSSEQLELLIAGYVLGDLSLEEAQEFEQLLQANPAIAQEVERMQKVLEISYAPPEVVPPPHLRSAIVQANTSQTEPKINSRPALNLLWRSPLWVKSIGVAAAALVVALGISNYRLRQSLQVQNQVRPSQVLTYTLSAKAANSPASATVTVDRSKLEAVLNVDNLPPLPPEKVYVLWTVLKPGAPFTTDSKNAILTEVFTVDDRGDAAKTIAVPAVYRDRALVAAVAITVEDAVSPQQHEGTPILIAKV